MRAPRAAESGSGTPERQYGRTYQVIVGTFGTIVLATIESATKRKTANPPLNSCPSVVTDAWTYAARLSILPYSRRTT